MNSLIFLISIIAPIAILSYVIIYLVSKILNKPDLTAYAGTEILGILFITFIVGIIDFYASTFANLYTETLLPNKCHQDVLPERCHIYVGGRFLELMTKETINFYSQMIVMNTIIDLGASLSRMVITKGDKEFQAVSFVLTIPKIYVDKILSYMKSILNILLAQIVLYWYATSMEFYGSLLLLGIMLRFLPPVKTLGGTLIAISIALYYVFPLVYVTLYAHYEKAYTGQDGLKIGKINIFSSLLPAYGLPNLFPVDGALTELEKLESIQDPNSVDNSTLEDMLKKAAEIGNSFINLFLVLLQALGIIITFTNAIIQIAIVNPGGLMAAVTGQGINTEFVNVLLDIITEFILILFVGVYIGLISMIAFVKNISPLLGGDIEIAGITRFL
jgi:hypothetical protein